MKKIFISCMFPAILFVNQANGQWSLNGNTGTNPANHFVGTIDNKALKIRTSNQVRVTVSSNGKVGIGNTNPVYKLDVKGNINLSADSAIYMGGWRFLAADNLANIWVGKYSGSDNTTGHDNITLGTSCLLQNTTGYVNIAIGNQTLVQNQDGYANTAIGNSALSANINGSNNTSVGATSLYDLNGNYNTAVGSGAATYLASGNYNTILGGYTCNYLTQGSFNTVIGGSAGNGIVASTKCLLAGYDAGSADSLTGATAIGAHSFVRKSYSMVLGDTSNISVGIGTTMPNARLHVDYNSSSLSPQLLLREQGADFARIHFQNTATSNYWALAALPDAVASSAKMNFYNSGWGDVMTLTGGGNVGIGTGVPAFRLELAANSAAKPGSSAWTIPSDARLKKEVQEFTDGLNVIDKLHAVTYQYTGEAGMPEHEIFVGTLAQELKEIAPYMVKEWNRKGGENNSQYLAVDYGAMDFILANAVKQLKDDFNNRMNALETENRELKTQMHDMENNISACCSNYRSEIPDEMQGSLKDAVLEQNQPNPFSEKSNIRCLIPVGSSGACINLHDAKGKKIMSVAITGKGWQEVQFLSGMLEAGTYFYSLEMNGRTIDTKQMIVTR